MKYELARSLKAGTENRRKVQRAKNRRCNLCAEEFHPRTVFDRYCVTCKNENELLKFSEWLPELDAAITERLSA